MPGKGRSSFRTIHLLNEDESLKYPDWFTGFIKLVGVISWLVSRASSYYSYTYFFSKLPLESSAYFHGLRSLLYYLNTFCFLTEEAIFSWKKNEILVSEYSKWSKTSRNMIFSWHLDVCVCVWRARVCVCVCVGMCACARLSNFQITIIHKRLEISS